MKRTRGQYEDDAGNNESEPSANDGKNMIKTVKVYETIPQEQFAW